MKATTTATILLCLYLSNIASAVTELSVTVTEGPKECDSDANTVKLGDVLHVMYTGFIDESSETGTKGAQFDTNVGVGPFPFKIGDGRVIQGWEQGLIGLCKGAKATLIVPPDMGYGEYGAAGGVIPGGATLKFDIEILEITDELPEQPNLFAMLDVDQDGKLSREEVSSFFAQQSQVMPDGFFENEDKNGDGFVDWDEFSGPKGSITPRDEL